MIIYLIHIELTCGRELWLLTWEGYVQVDSMWS